MVNAKTDPKDGIPVILVVVNKTESQRADLESKSIKTTLMALTMLLRLLKSDT